MASTTGGRFLFGTGTSQGLTLGINNGVAPVFPTPVGANFNIEVFTNATVSTLPTLDTGFQAGAIDKGGTLVAPGFLTGTQLQLFTGNYVITDANVNGRAPATITLGSGNQTIFGAGGDTLNGGSGTAVFADIVQFSSGAETITSTGSGPATVFGAPGDVVNAGSGPTYIDGTAGGMAIKIGTAGADTIVGTTVPNPFSGAAKAPDTISGGGASADIQSLGKGDVIAFAGQTGNATINATGGGNAVTMGGGAGTVFGGVGDTINLGTAGQYADGALGKMTINVGTHGIDSVFGSSIAGGGDTILGNTGQLNFNVQGTGGGDLINLAGSSGSATINAFAAFPGGTRTDIANVNDTIISSNGADSVFGGQGDRIGVGKNASGADLFTHATSIAGASMMFGTNSSAPGSSSATINIGTVSSGVASGTFAESKGVATDFLFFPGDTTAAAVAGVVATAKDATATFGVASTQFNMPDGTTVNLVGVSLADFTTGNPAGSTGWFKP